MATTDVDINTVLLQELRNMYPEVPERIVTTQMIKHRNDRDKVIQVLDHEGAQYLFETPPYDSIQQRMDNLAISQTEARTRSDSGSSGVSSTSTNSVSSVSSVPYGGGNSRHTPDTTEFFPFMNPSARGTNITNINCDVYSPSSPQVSSTTPTTLGKVNKPFSRLQPIQVQHVQTSQGQSSSTGGEHISPPPRVLIQVNPRQNNHNPQTNQFQPHYQQQLSYPSSNMTPQKWRTPATNTYNTYNPQSYHNMAGGISPGIYTVERSPYRKPPVSPQPSESMKPQSQISFPSQYGAQSQQQPWNVGSPGMSSGSHGGQQLSQAMIYLGGAKQGGHAPSDNRTYNSSTGTQYNPVSSGMHVSHSDPYLQSSYSSSSHQPQTPQSASNATKPLFIKVASHSQNAESGVPSQYRYQVPEPSGNCVTGPPVNSRYGNVIVDGSNRAGPPTGAVNPASYVGQLYLTEVSNVTTGNGSSSQGVESGQIFMHLPNVPNTCRVPGHPLSTGNSPPPVLPARTAIPPPIGNPSSESEHVIFGTNSELVGETQHISHATFQPLVSPASSQSSLSSDSSSQREIQRPRSGSVQEEAAYIQALLAFQKERMSKLKLDLESELRKLAKIRNEVNQMEKNMLDRQRTRNLNYFPHLEDVAKLRDLNMKLQADIQVMTREVDMYNNGQTPLGVLDPLEQQNFFKNMNPGQRGSIYSGPPVPTRDTPPPIPPRIHHVPPPPPPQPPTGSGDSDGDGEQWNCSACTFLNHPALNKCECCEMPRMNAPPPTTGPTHPHLHGT